MTKTNNNKSTQDDGVSCIRGSSYMALKLLSAASALALLVVMLSSGTAMKAKAVAATTTPSGGIRKLFSICNPDSCPDPMCDPATQVDYHVEGECCPSCLEVEFMTCETCPGGFTKTLASTGNCQECSCFGTSEIGCEDVDPAACSQPTCALSGPLIDCSYCAGHTQYFDGCNMCTCGEGELGAGACGRIGCDVYEEGYCIPDEE
mmetsp:Transcript_14467/g.21237  ORF Transcript_14467/g.21237 Transcript_14467/m.21237 type:complete len:205 (-) Transcript_14467:147-761(-)